MQQVRALFEPPRRTWRRGGFPGGLPSGRRRRNVCLCAGTAAGIAAGPAGKERSSGEGRQPGAGVGSRRGFWRCGAAGPSGRLGTSHGRVTAAASGAPGFLEALPGREADSLLKTWLLIAVVTLSLIFHTSIVQQFCPLPHNCSVLCYPHIELFSQAILRKSCN